MCDNGQALKKFPQLAALIVAGRTGGQLTQAEFATKLGFKQQAVSRWEAGTHRPTVSQIPTIAAIIGSDPSELMTLAGYAAPIVASVTALFPVDALEPSTFEHFVRDVVQELHPDASVRLQGSRGHTQGGTDVLAKFPDRTVWSFQCKRVERFGKAEIDKAVCYHSAEADRRFLVLSRIASPAAADAIEAHKGWTLWDKQDLTRLVRSLSDDIQDRLVDIYFRGQRMALLGRSEPGPWIESDRYFGPFRSRSAVFSHDWGLVGREAEIDALVAALYASNGPPVILLIGPGGIGKTRVLKEAVQRFAAQSPATTIRFLSTSREPGAASLEALGTKPKLIVVDDAHDREGLGLIIEFAADPRNRAHLLIASRPYAEQRIRNDLALVSIVDPPTVRLNRLDKTALKSLVVEVLGEFGGNADWADSILAVAADSPLVAAMSARVVAREGLGPELAKGESGLRQIILSRFTKVITGNLGAPADAPLLRAVLELLAVMQPFHIDDRRIGELAAATRDGCGAADVSRALKLLTDGGVIYKRGQLYRLMPDMLGDFLIEQGCIGADGKLTPFALAITDSIDATQLTQVLVNLGRMDWRLAGGEPSGSALLQPIWARLNAISDKYDPRIRAVEAVAYYQPSQVLGFVQAQLDAGRVLHEFGTILRRVALSPEHRLDALRLLWDLGREDDRPLNSHPSHPIRTLVELIRYERHKPLAFTEEVAEFAFGLIDQPDAWRGNYTPFDMLEPLLSGQGMSMYSTGRAISMSPFFVDHAVVVAHLRARLIGRTLELLQSPDTRIAHKAALFLNNAVHGPYGLLNAAAPEALGALYGAEFKETIDKAGALVRGHTLAPTTIIGIVHSLRWHAEHGQRELQDAVRAIFDNLPRNLEFRLYAALTDDATWSFVGQVKYENWCKDRDWASGLISELLAHKTPALADLLNQHLDTLQAAGESVGSSGLFIDRIIAASPEFGGEIIKRSVEAPDGRLCTYLGFAVGALLDRAPAKGRALIAELLDSSSPRLRSRAARGLIGLRRDHDSEDLLLLGKVMSTTEATVSSVGIMALQTWREVPDREMIGLALGVPFDMAPELFEQFSTLICSQRAHLLDLLSEADVKRLLQRMRSLPKIEGHWAGEMLQQLAKRHAGLLADFLFDRAEKALEENSPDDFWTFGFAQRCKDLNFHESPAVGEILPRAWAWLRKHTQSPGWVRYQAAEIFAAVFKVDSAPVVEFMETMLDQAVAADLKCIGYVLRRSHHTFPFKECQFVQRLLERCKAVDRNLLKEVIEEICTAATTGGWSGRPGEPMPRDVAARHEANAVLATMSRLSPAYPLYRRILDDAESKIARQIREGEALDAEE